MQKSFISLPATLVGVLLLGSGLVIAQQTPPATPAAPAKAQSSTTAAKAKTATTAKAPAPLALKTKKDKFSYALGMNLGESLQKQSVPVDSAILARGLRDAMAGKTLMTEQEARAALMAVQNDVQQKEQAKMQQLDAANKKEGDAFLAANKTKDGVVALPSGLQYKILTPGTGPKPGPDDTVVCNYRGTSVSGAEFDSSVKHGGPATFPVTGVIKGWTEILQLMPVGSKWQVVIPPDLAYGERGAPPDIGPGSTLIFDVELVAIKDKTAAAPDDKK